MNEKQLEKFKKAKDEVKNHDFNTATDILLDLYDETDDQQVVLLLGETLFMDQKYVGANRFVEDNFDVFLQQNFELLTRIYEKNHRYLQLRIIATGLQNEDKINLLEKIEQSEKEYEMKEPNSIASNAREFMHLGAFSADRQREVIKDAEMLPIKQYLAGSKISLIDPDVNPVWRMQLLNNLMRLEFDEPVDFIWIDNTKHQIIPKEVADVEQTNAFKEIQREVNETIGQQDPIKAAQLQVIIKVDMQILFPYIDQVVVEPHKWVEVIMQKMFGDVSKTTSDKDVLKWLSLIDSIMQTLVN